MVGSSNQTVTGSSGNSISKLEIASTGGTVSLSGSINVLNNLTYTSGTVDAGASTLVLGSNGTGAVAVNTGSVLFNDVTVAVQFSGTSITGTLYVGGNLSIGGNNNVNGGTLAVAGNLSSSQSGTSQILFNGTGTQTVSGTTFPAGNVTVNKPSGSVVLSGNTSFNGANQDLTITSGTLDMAGNSLTVNRNVANSGTLKRGNSPTCGTLTYGGTFTGNATICP